MSDARAIDHGEGMGIDEFARRCDTTVRMVREYQTLGVNRISMGVQALRDDLLKNLGRVHSFQHL